MLRMCVRLGAGLDDAAASLVASPAGPALDVVSVSGDTITSQDSLAAFTDAMLLSLPVAILLTSLTTFFGLIPIVLETSLQARIVIPMAASLARAAAGRSPFRM